MKTAKGIDSGGGFINVSLDLIDRKLTIEISLIKTIHYKPF